MDLLQVEATGSNSQGACACCGNSSRTVWGWVHQGPHQGTVASYYVHWTQNRIQKHPPHFDLIIGHFGEDAVAAERCMVALVFRMSAQEGPQFMVVDARQRPAASNPVVGRALQREDVVGQPLAGTVFSLVEAILAQDTRLAELLQLN